MSGILAENKVKGDMCGRYYVDPEMTEQLEQVVGRIDDGIRAALARRDVCPTDAAPVIVRSQKGLELVMQKWGYPMEQRKNLLINARAESVLDRPTFRNGIRNHRIAIPVRGFYEWNRLKEKNTFTRADAPVMYLAGICDHFAEEERFVILTTAANESMIRVHDRMPLVLEEGQLEQWFDDGEMEKILRQTPTLLSRSAEYEQQRLF